MIKERIVVSNLGRQHDRPVAKLVQLACQYSSNIILKHDERSINAKSIMGVIALNPSEGMPIQIEADGSDESDAVNGLKEFFVCR